MENNKMTELELKIEKWLENEQFVAFANERMNNVLLNKRHPIDPMFEEMDEGFDSARTEVRTTDACNHHNLRVLAENFCNSFHFTDKFRSDA